VFRVLRVTKTSYSLSNLATFKKITDSCKANLFFLFNSLQVFRLITKQTNYLNSGASKYGTFSEFDYLTANCVALKEQNS